MKKFLIGLLFAVGFSLNAWAVDDFTTYRPLESYRSVTATSASTLIPTPIGSGRFVVRLYSTTDAYVAFAATQPVASTATGFLLPAFLPEYIRVNQGEYIAVRASDAAGVLHITQMGR